MEKLEKQLPEDFEFSYKGEIMIIYERKSDGYSIEKTLKDDEKSDDHDVMTDSRTKTVKPIEALYDMLGVDAEKLEKERK